ncbi:MAG TPA: phage holin, LLH family [Clostridia bacterium]
MKEVLYNVLTAAVPALVVISGWVGQKAAAYLKSKIGESNFNKALSYAKTIVLSVEQTMGAGNGAAKKKVVLDLLSQKLSKYLSQEEINHLIESIVCEFNKQQSGGITLLQDSGTSQPVAVNPVQTAEAAPVQDQPVNQVPQAQAIPVSISLTPEQVQQIHTAAQSNV